MSCAYTFQGWLISSWPQRGGDELNSLFYESAVPVFVLFCRKFEVNNSCISVSIWENPPELFNSSLSTSRPQIYLSPLVLQLCTDLIIDLESCLCPPDESKSSIHCLFHLCSVSSYSWGKFLTLQLLFAPPCSPNRCCLCLSFVAKLLL